MDGDLPSGTVTFLFSDIEGSTALSRSLGGRYGEVRAEHRRILRETFARRRGSVLDMEGDACFVVFARVSDAVAAAIDVQQALEEGPVRVRIGMHTTEPHQHAESYVGVGVSRAARICAAAHGGQVLLSGVTAGVLEDLVSDGIGLRDLGTHRLKDIPHPERLYQLEAPGLTTTFPPLRAGPTAGSAGTLLVTDLSGFGLIMRALGDDAAAEVAEAYQTVVELRAGERGGYRAERIADHALCVFPDPEEALAAAAAIRASLREHDLVMAAAIHTGRLAHPAEGLFGSSAIRVMRLCRSAEPGQILVSHATHALVEGARLDGIALRDLGRRRLEDGDESSHVFEVVDT